MKRQLENTQKMLDKQGVEDDEDRELEREMDDLRYRIRRVQDDIEYYNRRGGRESGDLRRKAERELMHLMHERLPQLEKRIEAKDSRQRERKLGESRERDRRNDPYNRYASEDRDRPRDDDRGYSRSSSTLGDGEYLRGTFDRDNDRRRDDGDSYRRRDDDRDRDGGRSTSSSAPPPPPPVEPAKPAAAPPPPSTPAASSGPPKNMSAEERAAWIRSEAQRRVQERMRMLGAVAPAGPTPVDNSVEERLKAEQAEAAAKSAQADQEAAAREEARKARLEEHRLQNEKAGLATVKQEIKQAEKSDNPPPAPIVQAAKEEINDQEDMIRRREEVLAKEKAEREARLKRLEEQEEEARKQEEAFKERQSMFNSGNKSASSALPPPSPQVWQGRCPATASSVAIARRSAPAAAAAPPAPPATLAVPEAPPAPTQPSPTPSTGSSTNPFHRMQQGAGGAGVTTPSTAAPAAPPAPATPGGGTNPFFRAQQPAADSNLPPAARATPPVSAQPTGATPSSASRTIHTAPKHDDDDWEDSDKDDDDDEADGPGSSTRATRQNLAQALFSNLVPSSGRSTPPAAASAPSAPAAPPAPPAAPGAPPAPAAPAAPVAPVIRPAAGPADRGALLGQIQGGLRLKKAQTNDRSKALVTGSVIGDPSPPVQKYVPPPSPPAAPEPSSAVAERSVDEGADGSAPPPPPPAPPAPPAPAMPGAFDAGDFAAGNPNRQSVDWTNSLANDQANTKAAFVPDEPSVREEAEDSPDEDEGPEDLDAGHKPAGIFGAVAGQDEVDGFDLSRTVRVRTLYGYAGQREEDLSFEENDVLNAHPAKDAESAWWYGSLASGGKKGFFPRSYVDAIDSRK